MAENQEQPFTVPLIIIGAEDTPILFSNLMVAQHLDKEFVITFGQYSPPMVIGPDAAEQLKNAAYVPVKVVARIGLTPHRMQELINVLQVNLSRWQEKQGT